MTTYTAGHISAFFDNWAPESTKLDYDNIGLLTGSKNKPVKKVLTCLDVTEDVVDEALDLKCDLIVAHHPVIFKKLSRINPDNDIGKVLYKLISNDIAVLAVHTNLDAARGGVSFVMASQLSLKKNTFLTREENGPIPHGLGVIGEFDTKLGESDFLEHVKIKLNCDVIRYSGSRGSIGKVAVCGGSGFSLAQSAMTLGADAYITSDIKYHDFFTGKTDFMLLDVGHYESESPIINIMRDVLRTKFPELIVESTSVNTNPIQTYK
ncbi:MAG: Nif3-like dinuclear metal center hexameric protein [Balneolales bacterium]